MGNDYSKAAMPPQSIQAEQSLIGGLLLNPKRVDDVLDVITSDDFYNRNHRLIYQTLITLEENSQEIDVVTVSDALGDQLERVGGLAFIGGLASNSPGSLNVGRYAKIIREKAIKRNLISAAKSIQQIANGDGDISEISDRCEAEILSAVEERGEVGAVMLSDVSVGVIDRLEERINHKGAVIGLPTGFEQLDRRLSGLERGNLIIIAGRPSTGKTTLAVNIAENITLDGSKKVLIFSLEMTKGELADKITCSLASVDNQRFKNGLTNDDDLARILSAIGQQSKMNLMIDDSGDVTALQIKSRARKIKRKIGLDLIVIDYLQLMNMTKQKGETESIAIGKVTRQLKIAAKELNVPIILLSQLNRDSERRPNKRPTMADLRDSGAIEQDADIIMLVYRDKQHNKNTVDQDLAEIITAKYRNGQAGTDTLEFNGQFSRFSNTDKIVQSEAHQQSRTRYAGGFEG